MIRPFFAVAAAVGLLVAGCPAEPVPPTPRARLSLTTVTTGVFLPGASITLSIEASTASREADNTPVDITVTGDAVATVTPSVVPVDGKANVSVTCESVGDATVEASNGTATDRVIITCAAPVVSLQVEVAPVDNCGFLQGDGISYCQIEVIVTDEQARLETTSEVVVSVEAVSEVSTPILGLANGDNRVLSLTSSGIGLQTVTIPGSAARTFFVKSSDYLLSETVTLLLIAAGNQSRFDVPIPAPSDRTELDVTIGSAGVNAPASVPTGRSSDIAIKGTRFDGRLAAGLSVTVSLSDPSLGTLTSSIAPDEDGGITIALDALGLLTSPLTFDAAAGAAFPVEGAMVVVMNRGVVGPEPLEQRVPVTIVPAGTITVELAISSAQNRIVSDAPALSRVTLSARPSSDGDPVTVPARVRLDDSSVTGDIRFIAVGATAGDCDDIDGAIFDLGVCSYKERSFAAMGDEEFVVGSFSAISRGRVTVELFYTDDGQEILVEPVDIEVVRDPLVSSLVFVSNAPNIIGVIGSTLPNTAVVTFRLLSDENPPVAIGGEKVVFRANGTVDPLVGINPSEARTAADGTVTVSISAGTQAGPVSVIAIYERNGVGLDLVTPSEPVNVTVGSPSALYSYLVCSPSSVHDSPDSLSTSCTATWVDRVTDRVSTALPTHFRSEGGNVDATVQTGTNGSASTVFATGNPGLASADVNGWRYGTEPSTSSLPANCRDGQSSTKCDLVALCRANAAACPLPGAIDFTDNQSRPCYEVIDDNPRACGFPMACLTNEAALIAAGTGDPRACTHPGCFDYTNDTPCQLSGLSTITAAMRGEESFVDGNGDNVFNFVDISGDGRQSLGAEVEGYDDERNIIGCSGEGITRVCADLAIDSPKPFLDKNNSCLFDSFPVSVVNGMTGGQRFVASDLLNDLDGSGVAGFDVGGVIRDRNGVWDQDAQVFISTNILHGGTPQLLFGESCNTGGSALHTCGAGIGSAFEPGSVTCVEIDSRTGEGIAACALKASIADGGSINAAVAVVDGLRNCPGLGEVTVTSSGNVTGELTADLTESTCGINAGADSSAPWCELSLAGAPILEVGFRADCSDASDTGDSINIGFEREGGIFTRQIAVTVACPTGQ
jgi:hypothetical protein